MAKKKQAPTDSSKFVDELFLEELKQLCIKYKVNFQTDNLEFKNGPRFAWVEVTGQWKCGGAVYAEKIVRDQLIEPIRINS